MLTPVPTAIRRTMLVISTLVVVTACSSGTTSTSKPTSTSSSAPRRTPVHATVGTVDVASSGKMVAFADADRDGVVASIDRYIAEATLAPLTGTPAKDLAENFTASAAAALTGPEQDALVDTAVPKATGAMKTTLAPLNLTAFSDQGGAIDLVGTTFDLTVTTIAKDGPITIHRTGELMLTREGGAWKILGFTLAVTRDGAGLGTGPTSTTAASAP